MDIGDKPASFVNSREWIGSQEVGYVLGSLLDIDCKYIIIEKGGEAKKYMNQLRDHFMNQATPVMIGGGVLAFTCIGISIHPTTQDVKLLILVVFDCCNRIIGSSLHRQGRNQIDSIGEAEIGGLFRIWLQLEDTQRHIQSERILSTLFASAAVRLFACLLHKHRRSSSSSSSILQNNQRLWLRFLAI